MAGRYHSIVFSALLQLAILSISSPAQDATPSPAPTASPEPSSQGPRLPRRSPPNQNKDIRMFQDRSPFLKKGNEFDDSRKFFEHLSPEQREKFQENYQRWQEMTPEERNAIRNRDENRRQRILQEIDKAIAASGLQLDKDSREMYILRYTQERRKIEEKLQKEMEEKRKPLLQEMNNRLKQEFNGVSSGKSGASPTPAEAQASPTPAS